MSPAPDEQFAILSASAAEVIPADELKAKLQRSAEESRPLRVKLGIDPSMPDLHLGHTVVLSALRRFQDLGHTAILIVGDFTGRVGDPSGQSETRPMLSSEQLEANATTYFEQAARVLDVDRAEIRRNSEWLAPLTFADVAGLAANLTVARLLERDDFAERLRSGKPISLVEFLYPLMQGYDSVAVRSDVEIGGTDQTFNLLVGRDIQRSHGLEPQVAYTVPLLPGTDGTRKMSKSFDNQVGLDDPPDEKFGKTMSIPDELIVMWFRLCTGLSAEEVVEIERGLADGSLRPDLAKRRLAREIVTRYHAEDAARSAEKRFAVAHGERQVPSDVPEVRIPRSAIEDGRVFMPRLLNELNLAVSFSEARRLLTQGAVRLDGLPIKDPYAEFDPEDLNGRVLQLGRRRLGSGARLRYP